MNSSSAVLDAQLRGTACQVSAERVRVRADYVDDNAPNPVEEGRPATGTSRAGGGDSSAGMGMSASAANFDDDE